MNNSNGTHPEIGEIGTLVLTEKEHEEGDAFPSGGKLYIAKSSSFLWDYEYATHVEEIHIEESEVDEFKFKRFVDSMGG